MALTPNYGFNKQDFDTNDDTWGDVTNANWDIIDTALKALSDSYATFSGAMTGVMVDFAFPFSPTGWVNMRGRSIGSAASGATERANADTQTLYSFFWTYYDNTKLPIQDSAGAASTRGLSAAADFAANKRMPLPDLRGYLTRTWDDGRGIDSGRDYGTFQADSNKSHNHYVGTQDSGTNDAGGVSQEFVRDWNSGTGPKAYTTTEGGVEARPKNFAAAYKLIKL